MFLDYKNQLWCLKMKFIIFLLSLVIVNCINILFCHEFVQAITTFQSFVTDRWIMMYLILNCCCWLKKELRKLQQENYTRVYYNGEFSPFLVLCKLCRFINDTSPNFNIFSWNYAQWMPCHKYKILEYLFLCFEVQTSLIVNQRESRK